MSTLTLFVGLIVAAFTIIAGFFAAARAIWKAATSTQTLVGELAKNTERIVKNTAATEKLSGDLQEFSSATAMTLADHGTRITRLESR